MVRSKQTLKLITNEKARHSTFLKRKISLKKKINEFSILCDVDVCMLIYGPSGDEGSSRTEPPDVYPEDSDKLHRIIKRYKSMDKDDREKRSLTLGNFYDEHMNKTEDEFTKLTQKNDQDFEKLIWDDGLNNLTVDQLHQIVKKLDFKIDFLETQKQMMGHYGYYSSVVPNQNPADIPSTSKRVDNMCMQPQLYGQPFDHHHPHYHQHHNHYDQYHQHHDQYYQQMVPMDYPSYDHSSMMYDSNTIPMNLMSSMNDYDDRNFIDSNSGDFSYPTVQNQLPCDQKIITSMKNHMEFGNSTSYNLQQPMMVPPVNAKFPNMMMHGGSSSSTPALSSNHTMQHQPFE